jgi:hypothetical protein
VPTGEARRIRSAKYEVLWIFFYSLRFAYWRGKNRSTNSIGAE